MVFQTKTFSVDWKLFFIHRNEKICFSKFDTACMCKNWSGKAICFNSACYQFLVFLFTMISWSETRCMWTFIGRTRSLTNCQNWTNSKDICLKTLTSFSSFTLEGTLWKSGQDFKETRQQNMRFSSYFRSEFYLREEIFTVSGETPFLYLLAFLSRLS